MDKHSVLNFLNKYLYMLPLTLVASCNNSNDINTGNQFYKIIGNDSILNIVVNDKVKEEYQIVNGIKSGFYKLYDNMGNLHEEGMLIDNNKDGIIKTYNDSKLVSVSYFEKNELIYELDKNDFVFDTVNLGSFRLSIPKNWKSKTNLSDNILLISKKNCDSSFVFCPSFSVTKEKSNINLKDYVSSALSLILKNVEKMKVLHQNNIKINGFDIVQVRYMILKDGKKIGFQTGFFKIDDVIFVLTGSALNEKEGEFLKYDGLFEEIIISLHK